MVLQRKKNTSLLELLESHVGWFTPEIAVQPRPPTPLPTHTSLFEKPERREKERRSIKKYQKRVNLLPQKTLSPRKGQNLQEGHKEKTQQRAWVWRWFLTAVLGFQFGTYHFSWMKPYSYWTPPSGTFKREKWAMWLTL